MTDPTACDDSERGFRWVWAQNILTLAVLALGPAFRAQWESWTGSVAGVLLFIAGAVFGLAGVHALGRNRTPYPKPRVGADLVRHGIYGVVRHPLYSSLIFIAFGWGLLWRSWPALLTAFALAVLLDAKARTEERWLRKIFTEYAAYARRGKRLVPMIY